jgi:hypothetical protein
MYKYWGNNSKFVSNRSNLIKQLKDKILVRIKLYMNQDNRKDKINRFNRIYNNPNPKLQNNTINNNKNHKNLKIEFS